MTGPQSQGNTSRALVGGPPLGPYLREPPGLAVTHVTSPAHPSRWSLDHTLTHIGPQPKAATYTPLRDLAALGGLSATIHVEKQKRPARSERKRRYPQARGDKRACGLGGYSDQWLRLWHAPLLIQTPKGDHCPWNP